jgi:acyl transferase domain-containing protein
MSQYRADETALLFPPGGYHWPGQGADLVDDPDTRKLLERAESALAQLEVPHGTLRRLLAGEGQVQRTPRPGGWRWSGDFPLTEAAQTLLGSALAAAFVRRHGAPRAILGESMGEGAAYCASGALELEPALQLTYLWAQALQRASDALGLRMAVVEYLDAAQLEPLLARHTARVVIFESPTLHVCSLAASELAALDRSVTALGGRTLVSNNPCAAHDPLLAEEPRAFERYRAFVEELPLRAPRFPLWSGIRPGLLLAGPDELRANLRDMSFSPVRWADALQPLPALGVRNLLQLGAAPSGRYPLRKLCQEEPLLGGCRTDTVGVLEAVAVLPKRWRPTNGSGPDPTDE